MALAGGAAEVTEAQIAEAAQALAPPISPRRDIRIVFIVSSSLE